MALTGVSGRLAVYHRRGVITAKEREALELWCRGFSYASAGLALGISSSSVRSRLVSGLRKIAAAEGAAAAR